MFSKIVIGYRENFFADMKRRVIIYKQIQAIKIIMATSNSSKPQQLTTKNH